MGLSYEDLEVGKRYVVGAHTFQRDEVVQFAEQFDPQPFHLSEAGGEASMFAGLVASGWHTCSAMMGMFVRNFLKDSTSMGSPGLEEIRWLKPTRVGDMLTMTNVILSKRVLASKPDRGIVEMQWEGHNQHGELIVTLRPKGLFGLRNPGGRAT